MLPFPGLPNKNQNKKGEGRHLFHASMCNLIFCIRKLNLHLTKERRTYFFGSSAHKHQIQSKFWKAFSHKQSGIFILLWVREGSIISVRSFVQSLFEAHPAIRGTVKEDNERERFSLQQKRKRAGNIPEDFLSVMGNSTIYRMFKKATKDKWITVKSHLPWSLSSYCVAEEAKNREYNRENKEKGWKKGGKKGEKGEYVERNELKTNWGKKGRKEESQRKSN